MKLSRTATMSEEFLMSDADLRRLEKIETFKSLRQRAKAETQRLLGTKEPKAAIEAQEKLLGLLNEIYRRLDRGEEMAEITRNLDSEE